MFSLAGLRFRLVRLLRDTLQERGLHRRPPVAGEARLARRILDQNRLLLSNGIRPRDYYALGLDRPTWSAAAKREFIGGVAEAWLEAVNPRAYRMFSDDKLVFKRYMTGVGLPVPRLLGVFGGPGASEDGYPLRTLDHLRDWLNTRKIENVVIKPMRGIKGWGVMVIGPRLAEDTWARLPDGRLTFSELATHLARYDQQPGFLVEERLESHPTLNAICPGVVHTARIITGLEGDDVRVLAAALRIGMGDVPVDNFAQGGLVAPIALDSGTLGPARERRNPGPLAAHPRTGARIEGVVLPDWQAALELTRTAARHVPFNRCLGWDIALTTSGPVILEANDVWDANVIQLSQNRGILGTPLGTYLQRQGAFKALGLRLF